MKLTAVLSCISIAIRERDIKGNVSGIIKLCLGLAGIKLTNTHTHKKPYIKLLKYWVYSIVSQCTQGKYIGVHLLFEKSGNQKSPNLGGYALMRAAGHTTVFLHSSSFKEWKGNYVYCLKRELEEKKSPIGSFHYATG